MFAPKEIIITPNRKTFDLINFAELLRYKDLFLQLTVRDIKIRYKQTLLGVAWVIFQPVLSAAIFTIIFGIIIKLPSDGLPYPVFVFLGLSFWNFFATSISSTSGSLAGNESLIKKVYFPRAIVPISTIATNLIDLGISTAFLVLIILLYRINPHPAIFIAYPLSIVLILVTCTGLGLFLSALNVKYRDVRQILPFFIQILIFVTPVIYPVSIISPSRQWILSLNPLTSAIEMNRALLSGAPNIAAINLLVSTISALAIFIFGIWYFAKTENSFADVI